MLRFFFQLFSSEGFVARAACGTWSEELRWLHVIGDTVIALSYILISSAVLRIFYLYRKDRLNIPQLYQYRVILFYEFATFIFCCAITHINQVVVWWYPTYRFFGIWTAITGIISLMTVYTLWKAIGNTTEKKPIIIPNGESIPT